MKKLTKEDLDIVQKSASDKKNWIKVGMSTCGIAAGADEVFKTFVEEAKKRNIDIDVKKCGCLGMCHVEPLVEVNIEGLPDVIYGRVTKEVAINILDEHVHNKKLVNDHIYDLKLKK